MNNVSRLTKDETSYICSVIPYQDTIKYFNNNPNQFAKIRPGFRAKTISKEDARKLLFKYRSRNFVSVFIEKHISKLLVEIQEHFAKFVDDGDSKDIALIRTLPLYSFADNVGLYFKLVNEEHSEEYIALMSAIVKVIKEDTVKQKRLKKKINALDSHCKKLQTELATKEVEFSETRDRLSNRLLEINVLKSKVSILEKLQVSSKKNKEEIKSLRREKEGLLSKNERFSTEIAEVNKKNLLLEAQIKGELEKQQKRLDEEQNSLPDPKCPCDIVEFKEYLGYNLSNIGVPKDDGYFPLLISYLSKILFQGVPIVVNRVIGINLIKCVTNALMGKLTVTMMSYSQEITVAKISNFLSSSGRVVCLDNFIGNYNETELIPLVEKHRDKIVFFTVVYDRTLFYLSKEFLRYCYYFNANRIGALSVNTELTEDPSTFEEHSYIPQFTQRKHRLQNIFRELLGELNYPRSLIEHNCESIANEGDLCQLLAFNILPYCTDVLQIKPYNTSERLLKYAGKNGRCPQKNLFERWFT